ncbi:Hypothetical predicted protein [Cloeon dipterum]|uniref:C-type lectin domain-containing protein n=1 Tax=Cloeon dipterum TaxID=197152 RepID=A0A8S1DAG8_9INSE|nr:Hypothetical predicted protein [Cloeon dipterum]
MIVHILVGLSRGVRNQGATHLERGEFIKSGKLFSIMDLKIWILLALATQSFAAVFSVEEINTENYLLTGARFDELISERSGPPPSTKEQTTTTNYAESQSAASDSSLFDERVQVLEERLKRVTLLQMRMNKEIFEMRRRMLGRRARPTFPRICGTEIIGNDDVSSEEDIIYTRSLTPQSDSKYYVLSTKKLIWEQALLFCKEKGMQLASIETEAENKALYKLIGETKRTFWASGTDLGSEGTFYWNGTGSKSRKPALRGCMGLQGGNPAGADTAPPQENAPTRRGRRGAAGVASPPRPLSTYRWEDVRRAKARGGYPWTYLAKWRDVRM